MRPHTNAPRRRTVFAIALAVGISGSIAAAQEAGMKVPESSQPIASPLEVVIVTTLRSGPTNAGIVGPVQHISMSAGVRTDDLDPRSPAYRTELQDRIGQAARRLCDRMEFEYPVRIPDRHLCREAVERSAHQIDAARNDGSAPQIENP